MVYESALPNGTRFENLQVIQTVRGEPLLYEVECQRKDCHGRFLIPHDRLLSLPIFGFCAWPGCQPEMTRRPEQLTVNVYGFDNRRKLEGQQAFNLQVISRVSEMSPAIRYEVQCRLCSTKWVEARADLLALTEYKCRSSECRMAMQRAISDIEKRSQRRADAALDFGGI